MTQAHYIQAHLLLCGLVPNRPRPVLVHGLEVGTPGLWSIGDCGLSLDGVRAEDTKQGLSRDGSKFLN